MALSLSIKVTQSSNRQSLVITETTGVYAADNIGGWGSPNPETSDAVTATISVSKRGLDGSWGDTTIFDVFGSLPDTTGTEVNVEGTDVGLSSLIEDGIYRMVYRVTGSSSGTPFDTSVTKIFYTIGNIKCCLQKKGHEYITCNCGCDSVEQEFSKLSLDYRLLCAAIDCANLDQIQSYITRLTKKCNGCGCN